MRSGKNDDMRSHTPCSSGSTTASFPYTEPVAKDLFEKNVLGGKKITGQRHI